MALALTGISGGVTFALVAIAATKALNLNQTMELALALLSPWLAVTATVFGFYFSGHFNK